MASSIRRHVTFLAKFAICALLISLASPARAAEGLVLSPALTNELNQVLKASDVLHRALLSQNEEKVDLALRDVVWQLERARAASALAKPHERGHLLRILDSAHEHFELTQASYGEERRTRLEDGFNQIVNLVRIYKVDRSYSIFFCPKDRSTWVQKGLKAQYPFKVENREPCGIRVPK
jgi:hypothetical protein